MFNRYSWEKEAPSGSPNDFQTMNTDLDVFGPFRSTTGKRLKVPQDPDLHVEIFELRRRDRGES
jgi:hypothetical protein